MVDCELRVVRPRSAQVRPTNRRGAGEPEERQAASCIPQKVGQVQYREQDDELAQWVRAPGQPLLDPAACARS